MSVSCILLVRNDLLGMELKDSILGRHGVTVRTVASEQEALNVAAESPVDVVVLDRESSQMTSAAFVALWKSGRHAHAPLVLLAEDPEGESARAFLSAGGNQVMRRTAGPMEIGGALARLLSLTTRMTPRVPLQVLVKLELPSVTGVNFRSMFASTVDIGPAGLRLESQHPLEVGQELRMHLVLPGTGERLSLSAVVRAAVDAAMMHYGLEFLNVDEHARSVLNGFFSMRGAP